MKQYLSRDDMDKWSYIAALSNKVEKLEQEIKELKEKIKEKTI